MWLWIVVITLTCCVHKALQSIRARWRVPTYFHTVGIYVEVHVEVAGKGAVMVYVRRNVEECCHVCIYVRQAATNHVLPVVRCARGNVNIADAHMFVESCATSASSDVHGGASITVAS